MAAQAVTARVAPGRYDLLHGGSEAVDLSLLAARTAVVLRQISQGGRPTVEDQEILDTMAQLLSDAAHAVQFFDSHGRVGASPSGALAARVDAAIDAVLDEPQAPADPVLLAEKLSQLAERLRAERGASSAEETNSLGRYFSGLAQSVLNQVGHVGEVIVRA